MEISINDPDATSSSEDSELDASRNDREASSDSLDAALYTLIVSANDRGASSSSAGNANPIQRGIRSVNLKPINQAGNGEDYLRIAIITWNLNSQDSAVHEIARLANASSDHHLIIIGLQDAPARQKISQRLNTRVHDHGLLKKSKMGPLRLYIFGPVGYSFIARESEIVVDNHWVPHKRIRGAVGINITFKNITMNFICCHLSPHESKVDKRNAEIKAISRSILTKARRPPDLTVYFGDLNYRIHGLDRDVIFHALSAEALGGLHLLMHHDQLYREAARGEIFDGFCEGMLRFYPTYKFDVGTNTYDTSSKMRKPAWTDRVLFRVDDPVRIRADVSYGTAVCAKNSNHKPVRALLHLNLNTGDSEKSIVGM